MSLMYYPNYILYFIYTNLNTTTFNMNHLVVFNCIKWLLRHNGLDKICEQHKVQGHHTKVKGKCQSYHCTGGFIRNYKSNPAKHVNDLDLHFQFSTTSQRSKGQLSKLTCLCTHMGRGNVACIISSCCYL